MCKKTTLYPLQQKPVSCWDVNLNFEGPEFCDSNSLLNITSIISVIQSSMILNTTGIT
jgi:hypothetical protein